MGLAAQDYTGLRIFRPIIFSIIDSQLAGDRFAVRL